MRTLIAELERVTGQSQPWGKQPTLTDVFNAHGLTSASSISTPTHRQAQSIVRRVLDEIALCKRMDKAAVFIQHSWRGCKCVCSLPLTPRLMHDGHVPSSDGLLTLLAWFATA